MQFILKHLFFHKLTLGLLLWGALASSLPAASRYWDTNGSTSGVGGSGTWQLGTPALWNSASNGTGTLYTWANNDVTPDVAYFGGTAGTVSVVSSPESPIVVGTLYFTTAGYTLQGDGLTLPVAGTQTILEVATSGGDTTVDNDLSLVVPAASSGPRYRFSNRSTGVLTLNGNTSLVMTEETTAARTYDVDQYAVDGRIVLNGTFSESLGSGTTAIRFGENGGVDGAIYEVNGDNAAAFDDGARIHRGTVLVGHANALGGATSKTIRVGSNSTAAGQSAAVLTNGAMTLVNNVNIGGSSASTSASYVVGGATAAASSYSGSVTVYDSLPLTLRAAADGTVTFSGYIDRKNSSSTLTKDGAGTVILSYATGNFGAGDVSVKAGTLLVTNTSGSAHGSGNLTVESGATLGGTGRIAPSVAGTKLTLQGGATLLGGLGADATGTLTIQGDVSFLDSSIIKLVLGPDLSHSTIARTGGTWTFQADQLFTFALLEDAAIGTYSGILTGLDPATDVSAWRIAAASGLIGHFEMSGSDVNLVVSAIPEPSAALLIAAGLAVTVLLRRRPTL